MDVDLILPGIFAFSLVIVAGKPVIALLRRLKFGQSVRSDGPQAHLKKSGTPTMGGVLILLAAAIVTLTTNAQDVPALVVLLALLGYGAVGLLDDFLIVVRRRSLGLKARYKLLFQVFLALIVSLAALSFKGTTIQVPLVGSVDVPLWIHLPLSVFIIVGSSNAVNLTDGLDGLAAGSVTIVALAQALLAIATGFTGLAVLAVTVAGACLGFVWYNAPPAQVFMGDTGSLALGAFVGSMAVFTGTELYLAIIGVVFVAETLSVMIQVLSFRLRGKRVFKMAPLHHHYELTGLAETKVVARFWLVCLFFSLVGLYIFYRL
ncbi:MAG: phospho-N-acetylmuramoyl-pentapeptide-transferase [Firmicutes bacterium]|nr:phospho-N-acetylmuramoyl-pentapeptide-transferase [Bacillota bacterium]